MFFHKRGTKLHLENLYWSYDAIRNSCDKELQAILDSIMSKYSSGQTFGPLYYYQLVSHMTTLDSKAVCAITNELTSLKVIDQEVQLIARISKLIQHTIIWLTIVKMLPPDLYAIVYDTLETCTVPNFQLFVKTLPTNATLNRTTIHVEE